MIKPSSLYKNKTFLLLFLSLSSFLGVILFAYALNFDIKDISSVSKILIFDTFFIEYTLIFVLTALLINKYPIFNWLGMIIFILYIFIFIAQLTSLFISGEFISKLAVNNIEFIEFLITLENISIVLIILFVILILPFILTYIIMKKPYTNKLLQLKYLIGFLLLFSIILFNISKFVSTDIIKGRDSFLVKNSLPHMATIQAFIDIYRVEKDTQLSFSKQNIKQLQKLGYSFNPIANYPLLKNEIYTDNLKFQRTLDKPNIIVIFTEGFSARTSNVYSNTYENLTPNLKDFSEDNSTMKVNNFYNHTAATYRGLHGQLCSLYPTFGKGSMWFENDILDLSKIHYKCLPHILQDNLYETVYLNMHFKDKSANDDMVSHFGFDTILSANSLAKDYLSTFKQLRSDYLSDHQSYTVLKNYLKKKEKTAHKPFLLAMYTIETHAFVDIVSDGIPYKDGKNNVLNTIHNMDDAFGTFWKYFKNSKFAKNTIIIFTSDHAHYFGKEYITTLKKHNDKQYYPIFIDKVPLLIYAPNIKLPKEYDAKQSTSIDLAPTILHLLQIKNEKNAFVGSSLFEQDKEHLGIASYGRNLYMLKENNIFMPQNIRDKDKETFNLMEKYIKYTHKLEKTNKVFPKKN